MIIVDSREQRSAVIRSLNKLQASYDIQKLEIGDYLIGDMLCVERKEVSDYVSSLVSGRLNNQLYQMSTKYTHSLLVVEGSIDEVLFYRKLKKDTYFSSLAGAFLKRSPESKGGFVSVVIVGHSFDTALLLNELDKKFEQDLVRTFQIPTIKIDPQDRAKAILCAFPGIGEKKALGLLERFGNLRTVLADLDHWHEVKGISMVMTGKYRKFMEMNFSEEK